MMTGSDALGVAGGTRLVHIGPPKTGTTAIQKALAHRRADLLDHGIVFPGNGYRPRDAGWAVVGAGVPRGRPRQPTMADWQAFVDEVAAAGDNRVVTSNESFADAYADAVRTIVDGFGRDRIRVVYTVRRIDKLLSSHWQQRVQAGLTLPYEDWLRIVLGEPDEANGHWRGFWRHHDLADVLDRWDSAAGADRISLIIADEDDRQLLPRLFERFLDLPDGYLQLGSDDANRSMSRNEIELVRHLHLYRKRFGWDDRLFRDVMRFGVTTTLLQRSRDLNDTRIELPAWAAERAAELNDERIATIRSLGVQVIGDPELLCSTPSGAPEPEIPEVRIAVDTAAEAIAAAINAGEKRRIAAEKRAKRYEALAEKHHDTVREQRAAAKAAEARSRATQSRRKAVIDTTSRELVAELRTRIARRIRRR